MPPRFGPLFTLHTVDRSAHHCGRKACRKILWQNERPPQKLMPIWWGLRSRRMIPRKFQQVIQFFHQLVECV